MTVPGIGPIISSAMVAAILTIAQTHHWQKVGHKTAPTREKYAGGVQTLEGSAVEIRVSVVQLPPRTICLSKTHRVATIMFFCAIRSLLRQVSFWVSESSAFAQAARMAEMPHCQQHSFASNLAS